MTGVTIAGYEEFMSDLDKVMMNLGFKEWNAEQIRDPVRMGGEPPQHIFVSGNQTKDRCAYDFSFTYIYDQEQDLFHVTYLGKEKVS